MLTRLKIDGFKTLVDTEIFFGPFTCVAGANGVGKSNLFDAIRFLGALADKSFLEAALSIRDDGTQTADVRHLFHRAGRTQDKKISFEANLIVPEEGVDDLGQPASASVTFLRYSLDLEYCPEDPLKPSGELELTREELKFIRIGEARKNLLFDSSPDWRKSVLRGKKFTPFISTTQNKDNIRVIRIHQDRHDHRDSHRGGGRPRELRADKLPRTVLSHATAAECPTALLAKREMQSWHRLQLEPAALRKPDDFKASPHLGPDGSHLAATLFRLAGDGAQEPDAKDGKPDVYAQVTNRLSELIDEIREIRVDKDDKRELLTLMVEGKDGTANPAKSLSDRTLRFLALTVMENDPEVKGLICLEEPENGIHPERIPSMLRLLRDIAVDIQEPVGPGVSQKDGT